MKLFTRRELAEIIASEETNRLIDHPKYEKMYNICLNYLLTCSEDDFIHKFEKDKKFKLIRVIKNRYFI